MVKRLCPANKQNLAGQYITTALCPANKHKATADVVRNYTYNKKYKTANGEIRCYSHTVVVCLACLKEKRTKNK